VAKKKPDIPRGATPRPVAKPARQWRLPQLNIRWQWLLLPLLLVALVAGMRWGYQSWPVTAIDVSGRLSVWQADEIARQLVWVKGESFFSLDVEKVHRQLQALPLVLQVNVRKRWPGTLDIRLYEDVPVALWNNDQLLSASGMLSAVPAGLETAGLTRMQGSSVQAEQAVRYFRRIQQVLAGNAVRVEQLHITATGAVRTQLNNGWQVEFGRQYFEERVLRLAALLARLPQEKVQAVDLRYGKGAAIRWHQDQEMGS